MPAGAGGRRPGGGEDRLAAPGVRRVVLTVRGEIESLRLVIEGLPPLARFRVVLTPAPEPRRIPAAFLGAFVTDRLGRARFEVVTQGGGLTRVFVVCDTDPAGPPRRRPRGAAAPRLRAPLGAHPVSVNPADRCPAACHNGLSRSLHCTGSGRAMLNGWYIAGAALIGALAGGLILYRTKWFQLRLYGARVGSVVKRHDLQKKSEAANQAVQRLGDPAKAGKHFRDLAVAYDALIKDLEKIKAPRAAKALHDDTLTLNRKAAELYRLVSTGKFSPKEVQKRQAELQRLEKGLNERVQALYGKKVKTA